MTKILLTNSHCLHNKDCEYNRGSDAVISSAISILKEYFSDAQFTSLIQLSDEFISKNDIKSIRSEIFRIRFYSFLQVFKSSIDLLIAFIYSKFYKKFPHITYNILTKRLKAYEASDLVIDLSMDTFSDDFGIIAVIEHCKDLLIAKFLNRPIILFAQSLGPFRNSITSCLVKYSLNCVDLITVREKISKDIIKDLNISTPVYLTADPAFCLSPIIPQHKQKIVEDFKPFIGLTISSIILLHKSPRSLKKIIFELIFFFLPEKICTFFEKTFVSHRFNLREEAIEDLAEIIDELINKFNKNIILIPHTIISIKDHPLHIIDDRYIESKVFEKIKNKERVLLLIDELSSNEIKWIIGQSDVFIGSKMHSNIAALSQGIPTIAISYSHKFRGIMDSLGLGDYICSQKLDKDEILMKTECALLNCSTIKNELNKKIPLIKNLSSYNGELVRFYFKRIRTR